MPSDPVAFIHDVDLNDLPAPAIAMLRRSLLDLIGVGVGGAGTSASAIMRAFAAEQMPGQVAMFMDGRPASPAGCALATGMTIDALDGHDGYNPAKGHIGCVLFAAVLPLAMQLSVSGRAFLSAMAMGYEFGARASIAQHQTVPDYHTSGSWGAVTAAAACARLMGLDREQTRHALGIAEYHGPRSQMMRCIDHPTMVKDGAGWGALAGISAAFLARQGFTGAPAITVEDAAPYWEDLGRDWKVAQQYFKPYPVCRWAQAPVEALLALREEHRLSPDMVDQIIVETFHEAVRLATARPRTTEEAQYSTSFPCAVAMVHGAVTPGDLSGAALSDPEICAHSERLRMREHARANDAFPDQRMARVTLVLKSGQTLRSEWTEPKWEATAPPSAEEIRAKFTSLAEGPLGPDRASGIVRAIDTLESADMQSFYAALTQPINA